MALAKRKRTTRFTGVLLRLCGTGSSTRSRRAAPPVVPVRSRIATPNSTALQPAAGSAPRPDTRTFHHLLDCHKFIAFRFVTFDQTFGGQDSLGAIGAHL